MFTQQILYSHATPERKALYLVTLSEPSVKLLHYLQRFNFFDADKVNTAVTYLDIGEVIREKGLEDAIAIIIKHVQEHKPSLVAKEIRYFEITSDGIQIAAVVVQKDYYQ